jgi:hypothetical protein
MESGRILSSFVGLLVLCGSIGVVLPRWWTVEPAATSREKWRDLSGASIVEIMDGSRRSVLRGELQLVSTAQGDVLKSAQLVSDEGEAVGKAEIELVRQSNGVLVQELEVDVDGLPGDSLFTLQVDGQATGRFRTDSRGGAELEQYGRVQMTTVRAGD